MPSRKAALISFAVFVFLVGAVWLTRARTEQANAMPTAQYAALLPLSGAGISRVEVHAPGKEAYLVLSKKDDAGQWWIEQPVYALADQNVVQSVVDGLADLQVLRTLSAGTATVADFGLEPPQFTVQVQTQDGSSYTIEVGSYNLDGTKRYVRMEGKEEVYLVYPYQLDRLNGMIEMPPLPPTPTPQPTQVDTVEVEQTASVTEQLTPTP